MRFDGLQLTHAAMNPIVSDRSRTKTGLTHLAALDGIRGLAILLVMPHHIRVISEPFDTLSHVWAKLGDFAWLGVEMFFVLSGFLITRILLASQPATNYYTSFYGRRALRILPLYYTVLAIWWFLLPVVNPASVRGGQYGYLWLFLVNWTQPFHASGNGVAPYWSLAVEEQFYLFWPVLIRRLSAKFVFILCCGLTVAALGIRTGMLTTGWPNEAVYEWTVCRMDALALGAAVAAALAVPGWREKLLTRSSWLSYSAVGVFLFGAAITRLYQQTGIFAMSAGYTLAGVAFALWVLVIALGTNPPFDGALRSPFLQSVGKYSYAMYVLHVPVTMTLDAALKAIGWTPTIDTVWADVLRVCLYSVIAWGTAMLSYRFLEAPALRLKRYFELVYPESSQLRRIWSARTEVASAKQPLR